MKCKTGYLKGQCHAIRGELIEHQDLKQSSAEVVSASVFAKELDKIWTEINSLHFYTQLLKLRS